MSSQQQLVVITMKLTECYATGADGVVTLPIVLVTVMNPSISHKSETYALGIRQRLYPRLLHGRLSLSTRTDWQKTVIITDDNQRDQQTLTNNSSWYEQV
jgi:hypothetical protein